MSRIALIQRDHRRTFHENLYVYAVVSRRSKGVSIGVNLNPDKVCNFDCIYCQVDRRTPPIVRDVDVPRLLDELQGMLGLVRSGELFEIERFQGTPVSLRRLNDIAFSGDGEPTTCPQFLEVVEAAAALRQTTLPSSPSPLLPSSPLAPKLVLITNATRFQVPQVQEALRVMDANNGEIWAKLDAGTKAYYHEIERTTIPFQRVLDNITVAARQRPIVIQAMFLRLRGQGPSLAEQEAFCERLNEIVQAGGAIILVQVYTVARVPAEAYVAPLDNTEVDALTELVRLRTGLSAESYYGPG